MKEILKLANIYKSFFIKEEKRVLDDVSITLYEGDTTCLMGETGSGKTTLARLIIGLEIPSKGDIFFEGKKMPPLKKRSFSDCGAIQYIFQDPYSALNNEATVEDVLMEPYRICVKYNHPWVISPEKSFEAVGLGEYSQWRSRRINTLSGGQRQKISIARALIPIPKLLIADESTSMLDRKSSGEVLEVLENINKEFGITLLIITHHLKVVERGWDKVYILKDGRVIEDGTSEEILFYPKEDYTKELVAAMKLFGEVNDENIRSKS